MIYIISSFWFVYCLIKLTLIARRKQSRRTRDDGRGGDSSSSYALRWRSSFARRFGLRGVQSVAATSALHRPVESSDTG
jgi:hypothetical protein